MTQNSTILDIQIFNELRDLMGEGLPSLVDRYLVLSGEYIAKIEQGIRDENATQAEEAAHPLKSSSLQLSAIQLYELAKVVEEEAANHHRITPRLRESAAQLQAMLATTAQALQQALAA